MACWFVNNFLNNVLACTSYKIGIFGVVGCEKLKKNLQHYKNWYSSIIIQSIIFHYIWLIVCDKPSLQNLVHDGTPTFDYMWHFEFFINLKPHNKLDDCEKPQLFVGTNKTFSHQHHFPCNLSLARSLLEKFSWMKTSILDIKSNFSSYLFIRQFNENY